MSTNTITVAELRSLLTDMPDDHIVVVDCEHSSEVRFAHPAYFVYEYGEAETGIGIVSISGTRAQVDELPGFVDGDEVVPICDICDEEGDEGGPDWLLRLRRHYSCEAGI